MQCVDLIVTIADKKLIRR